MKTVTKLIDVNSHIRNLKCDIVVNGENTVAHVSFKNGPYGVITAIKFSAIGYNSFGDIVKIGENDHFLLIIQDINIGRNENAIDLKAKIPSQDIRKIDLIENQICYADGTVTTYKGKKELTYDVEELELARSHEAEQRRAFQWKFGDNFIYIPKKIDDGWICGCGEYNFPSNNRCLYCGVKKEYAFNACETSNIKKIVEDYNAAELQRKENEKREQERSESQKRQQKIKIIIGVLIALLLVALLCKVAIMSGRMTFATKDQMISSVSGTYTYYNDRGKATRQLIISEDNVCIAYASAIVDPIESHIKEWNYRDGTFTTFQTYVVLSNGDIKEEDGDVYKKGGYMSTPDYSNGETDLNITIDKVKNDSSYTICTGSVKNNGTKTYKFIKVKGAFEDSSGDVIDTDWTYAAGSEGLAPGESTTFRLSVTKNSRIISCSVSLLDYD